VPILEIWARLRTPARAVQRGLAGQCFVLKRVLSKDLTNEPSTRRWLCLIPAAEVADKPWSPYSEEMERGLGDLREDRPPPVGADT
jgi:hypothetical protein